MLGDGADVAEFNLDDYGFQEAGAGGRVVGIEGLEAVEALGLPGLGSATPARAVFGRDKVSLREVHVNTNPSI